MPLDRAPPGAKYRDDLSRSISAQYYHSHSTVPNTEPPASRAHCHSKYLPEVQ